MAADPEGEPDGRGKSWHLKLPVPQSPSHLMIIQEKRSCLREDGIVCQALVCWSHALLNLFFSSPMLWMCVLFHFTDEETEVHGD